VIVLDENILESQRTRLRGWRIHLSQIGRDLGRKGMQDEDIIPLLRTLRRPTFVSWDRDFFERSLCSDRFCLVYLDVGQLEVAAYLRRLLRHPQFKTWAQRKGRVVRVAPSGISAWHAHAARVIRHRWVD
jgi:hypothetical protein